MSFDRRNILAILEYRVHVLITTIQRLVLATTDVVYLQHIDVVYPQHVLVLLLLDQYGQMESFYHTDRNPCI